MKESEFIDQNKNKWFEYETLLKQNSADPEALSEVFIQVTDDLSYSRTHYPNRSVRVYLNNLARFIFDKIGKRKRFDLKNMLKFFRIEVPQLFYKARFEMLISFGVFMLAFVIGVYSSAQDEGFAKLILGDAYVAITDQNINNDDPMAIYRTGKGIDSFLGILINNARVDILMLSLGMIFGVGALFVLISNGIMVGAFQYYFYAHGGFEESLATIWMHGTIEITTIILIGGVGMMAGKGLLFPRSYTRFQSFRISASNAAKLLLAVLPFTFVAALIEGFLTRQTTAPFAMKLGVIVLSLIVVVGYFIIYPYFVNKRYGSNVIHETLRNPAASKPIDLHEIKSPAAVISEAFKSYKSNTKLYLSLGFAVASGLVVFVYVFWAEYFVNLANPFFNFLFETVSKDVFKTNPEMSSIVSQGGQLNPWGFAASISAVFALVVAVFSVQSFKRLISDKIKLNFGHFLVLLLLAFGASLSMFMPVSYSIFNLFRLFLVVLFLFGMTTFLLSKVANSKQKKNKFAEVLLNVGPIGGLWILLLVTTVFIYFIASSYLIGFFTTSVLDYIPVNSSKKQALAIGANLFSYFGLILLLSPLYIHSVHLFACSLFEKRSADKLRTDLIEHSLIPLDHA